MAVQRPTLIRPGEFGLVVAADARRGVFDSHNEALLAKGVPIATVFIGDSITDMWALDAFFRSTSGLLVNRGIGGDRSPYVRRRFEADVLQLRPRLAVILIGVNNTWDLDIWWDPRLLRTAEEIEDEIVADTAAMVSAARAGGRRSHSPCAPRNHPPAKHRVAAVGRSGTSRLSSGRSRALPSTSRPPRRQEAARCPPTGQLPHALSARGR